MEQIYFNLTAVKLLMRKVSNPAFLLFCFFCITNLTLAQTSGPNNAGTGTNVTTTGTVNWANNTNILADDTAYATASIGTSAFTRYLQGTNYGFSIPTGAVINGISATIMRQSNSTASGRSVSDATVTILKSGLPVGTNKALAGLWPSTMTAAAYGGPTDLWGTTWTAAEINSNTFGIALSATANATRTASVDYMQITVYFTPPPTISGFTGSGVCFGSTSSVIITGTHLLNASAVSFNGTAATYTVNSNTQITAQLPLGATSGPISVTTPSGTGNSAASFIINPLPTVDPITGNINLCIGVPSQLSNSTPGGVWSSGSPTVATINAAGLVSPINAGTSLIKYTVTNGNGCTNESTLTITVNNLPVVSAPANACVGNNVQLSPSSGGTWVSNNPSVASVDNTGLVTGLAAGNATFTFTNSATGCYNTTTQVTVNVLPSLILQPISQNVCSSSNVTFSVGATGTNLTYQWYKGVNALSNAGNISGADTASMTISNVALSDASADYHCVVESICGGLVSDSAVLTVEPEVAITAQQGPLSTCVGESAVMFVTASNASAYQWYNNGLPLSDTGNISGSATSTLTINPVALSDASADYYCVISGTLPCSDKISADIALTVNEPALVTVEPAALQTVCSGTAVTINVAATGSGLTYQWYNGVAALTNSGNITGADTAVLSINPVSATNSSTDYHCVVTALCGSAAVSASSALTVIQKVEINTQPASNQILCSGDTAMLSVQATGDGLTYQWYNGAAILVDGTDISGAQTDTLTLSNLLTSQTSALYHCVVSGISPCTSVSSSNATITINQSPIISAQPAVSQARCSGTSVSFSVTASGGGLNYQWYKGATALTNGGSISGATSSILTINPVSVSDSATDYYCVVSNLCSSDATSGMAELIVSQRPSIPAQTATICSTETFGITLIDGIPDASVIIPSGTTYSWPAPTASGITGGQAQSGQTSIFGTLTNVTNVVRTATYTVTPLSATGNCVGTPFTVVVTVKPRPSIINYTRTVCNNQAFTVLPANGGGNILPAGTTYSWPAPVVTGGLTGGAAGTNAASISQTFVNPTDSIETAIYTVTPSVNGCDGNPFTITVSVNPPPAAALNVTSQTSCSGTAISPIIISNTNSTPCNITYNWVRDNTVNVTGTASGAGTFTSAGTFTFSPIFTNTTTTAQTVTITITPSSNGIAGTPITTTVIVQAPSAGGAVTIPAPAVTPVATLTTVCHFASGTLYLSGNTGNVVRWEYSITGGAVWIPISNTSTTYTYTNIDETTLFRAIVQNGTCSTANSTAATVNVIPNVKPTPVAATPSVICVGESSVLTSQSGYATSSQIQQGGTFSNSNPAGWLADGCGNCLSAGGSNTNPGGFQLSATNGGTYSGINYASVGKFAIANGNFNSIIETPAFNTLGLTTASLRFNHAFNLLAGAWARVELSLDGGATYGITLFQWNGPSTRSPYNAFPLSNLSLNNYIGQTNLKVRFNYHGTVGSSWAIDNILIPEMPANLATQWVDVATGQIVSTAATITVSPAVTTTYAITTTLNGCTSFGPDGTTYVTVTVNPRPTAVIGTNQTICYDGTATFSVALTGVAPWTLTYSNGTTNTTVNNIMASPYVFNVNNVTANQTYTITALNDSRCNAQPQHITGSATVTVLNGTQGLWTGLVSNDWFDCMNWAGGLPTLTVNAVIPAGAPRMPVIDPATSTFAAAYSNIAAAQDVVVAASASLTMIANSNLQVSRDWKNSGTFNPGTGTVTFNGTQAGQIQTINSGIKNFEGFYNVIVNMGAASTGVSVANGFELTITNLLTLTSGDLRLTGEAQLVQLGTAPNPVSGTGKLLRDQQGTKSSFNYNYWSSPVSNDGINYTVSGVLRDGTNSAASPFLPGTINFANGVYFADGALASPIKISNSWINKYTAVTNSYYGWQYIGSTGNVKIGEGFTMKGTDGIASVADTQNYVFMGKPNNGDISLTIALAQSYLIGNPYPSALDADQFIRDNIKDGGNAATNVFTGALYFWDHFGGHTHLVAGYVGGYATYSLMGGVVAIANSPLNINDGSTGIKVPTRYVAVGQAFFIGTILDPLLTTNNPGLTGPVTGGTVSFKNSQRAFRTEASAQSVFFRPGNALVETPMADERAKIRLKFDSASGMHRQLLVGSDQNATDLFDLGYDAPSVDVNGDDIYWQIPGGKFVIQALPDFNTDRIIPLGIKTATAGVGVVSVAGLENFDSELYLFDSLTGIYHDIRDGSVSLFLEAGEYTNRFSLRFSDDGMLGNDGFESAEAISITYANDTHAINIKNQSAETEITTVSIYNMLGQHLMTYQPEGVQPVFKVSLNPMAAGTYIAKVNGSKATVTRKFVVK